jgi:hypothetical protein
VPQPDRDAIEAGFFGNPLLFLAATDNKLRGSRKVIGRLSTEARHSQAAISLVGCGRAAANLAVSRYSPST